MSVIKVNYEVASTKFKIKQILDKLSTFNLISFDSEVQAVYTIEERKRATKLVEQWKKDKVAEAEYSREDQKLIRQIGRSSGLSHPSITKVTHFIFGISENFSYVLISYDMHTEMMIWNWLAQYKGKVVIHNALFDLKIMHHRVHTLPINYDDTQLMAKCLINDADEFEGKVGLKHLMASYFDPKWTLLDEEGYDNPDYKNEAFLRYSAIDGCACWKLYKMLTEEMEKLNDRILDMKFDSKLSE